jgi:hypothetical protein
MTTTLRNALLAAALVAGTGSVALMPVLAQDRSAAGDAQTGAPLADAPRADAPRADAHRHGARHLMPGELVDGRIAFLKAELKVTAAQEAQWQQVATAMRDNASALDQAIAMARQNRSATDAVQRLEQHQQFAKLRADGDARLLTAFKPFYASLSPEQQQMANRLIGGRHHHDWHRRA